MKTAYKVMLLFVLLITATNVNAQLSLYKYNEDTRIKFSLRYAANKATGVSQDSVINIKAILFRTFELDKINYNKGQKNVSHRWAFIPETFMLAIIDALDGGDFGWGEKVSSSNIGDFILGWHNTAWNVVTTDDFNLGVGYHWGDYFLAHEPYDRAKDKFLPASEPAGWYGVLGPSVMLDYNIMNKAIIHIEGAYGISKKFTDLPEMNSSGAYPSPHFLNITAQIRTNSIFYGGMEHITSINRGSNDLNISRTDFYIGVWL